MFLKEGRCKGFRRDVHANGGPRYTRSGKYTLFGEVQVQVDDEMYTILKKTTCFGWELMLRHVNEYQVRVQVNSVDVQRQYDVDTVLTGTVLWTKV